MDSRGRKELFVVDALVAVRGWEWLIGWYRLRATTRDRPYVGAGYTWNDGVAGTQVIVNGLAGVTTSDWALRVR